MSRNAEKRSALRPAFTLIELLVVVAIIALLISILLPSLQRARQQARRVVCGSQIRSYVQTMTLYAEDNGGVLADPGNFSGTYNNDILKDPDYILEHGEDPVDVFSPALHRMHPRLREIYTEQYQLPRKFFYCPSNKDMNWDPYWVPKQGQGDSAAQNIVFPMTGYMFLSGRREFAVRPKAGRGGLVNPRTLLADMRSGDAYNEVRFVGQKRGYGEFSGGFERVWPGKILMPMKLSDDAHFTEAVFDFGYAQANTGALAFNTQGEKRRPNHILTPSEDPDFPGMMPRGQGGMNVGYLDGSARWRKQGQLGQEHPTSNIDGRVTGYRWFENRWGGAGFRYWW